jgi:hypothetical protein
MAAAMAHRGHGDGGTYVATAFDRAKTPLRRKVTAARIPSGAEARVMKNPFKAFGIITTIVLLTIGPAFVASALAQEVPVWGMFETAVSNPRSYANPFVDTELRAVFMSPSGQPLEFFGFYDGDSNGGQNGTIWKLRFMCTEPGTWRWSAMFSDGVRGGSGRFDCVNTGVPGPLRVDEQNRYWLKQANGRHFLPRWYYLHELLFSSEGIWQLDVDELLTRNGYNMVTVLTTQAEHLVANRWNRRAYEQPYFYPWLKSGGTANWTTPDLASWRKLDRVLRYLADRDVYVYFFDGFFPNIAPHFPDDPNLERWYIRYVLARIGAYWNVTHNIAFEFSEIMTVPRLQRIGRYIKDVDPFKLLLTVHDTQNAGGLVQTEPWLDLANLQYVEGKAGSAAISNPFVVANYYEKPIASTEVVWEGADKLSGDQVRRGAWGIMMAASFLLYGEFNIGGTGVGQFGLGTAHSFLRIMHDFMQSVPYWTMKPHNELTGGGAFCLANPGAEYIVYAENGGPVGLDLSAATGAFSVEWLNPRTGQRTPTGAVAGGTNHTFASPREATSGDWVLHVRSGLAATPARAGAARD